MYLSLSIYIHYRPSPRRWGVPPSRRGPSWCGRCLRSCSWPIIISINRNSSSNDNSSNTNTTIINNTINDITSNDNNNANNNNNNNYANNDSDDDNDNNRPSSPTRTDGSCRLEWRTRWRSLKTITDGMSLRPQPQTFSKLTFLSEFSKSYTFLNWLSGALVGVGGSDFIGYLGFLCIKIHQRGVQWKQGDVIHIIV